MSRDLPLITFSRINPTTALPNFDDVCRDYGDIEINGKPYPRLQILTVPEILEGKSFKVPGVLGNMHVAQAQKMLDIYGEIA